MDSFTIVLLRNCTICDNRRMFDVERAQSKIKCKYSPSTVMLSKSIDAHVAFIYHNGQKDKFIKLVWSTSVEWWEIARPRQTNTSLLFR